MGFLVSCPFTIRCKKPEQHSWLSCPEKRLLNASGPCCMHVILIMTPSPWAFLQRNGEAQKPDQGGGERF